MYTGKTFAEKILGLKSNKKDVSAGEVVMVSPDILMCCGNTAPVINKFSEIGAKKIWDPKKVVIILDHFVPAESVQTAAIFKQIRHFVREQGIIYFYDEKEGICHQIMVENCHALPGKLILGKDSHTPSYGCLGCFSPGIGNTDAACIMATGKTWLRVPESVKITIQGLLPKGVYSKDIALKIAKDLTSDGCTYKCIEYYGTAVDRMEVSDRFTIANMSIEMGAKASYFSPNDITLRYIVSRSCTQKFDIITPDKGAHYEKEYEIDVSSLEPMVACPHEVDNSKPIGEIEGLDIQQGFIGSCTNGREEDLEIVAKILSEKKVHPDVRLLIAPASKCVYLRTLEKGYIKQFLLAGAMVLNPGCSACFGGHQGLLADNERCVSSSNRNFKGRMGSIKAEVYLASPATVAASCIEGRITDPRKYI